MPAHTICLLFPSHELLPVELSAVECVSKQVSRLQSCGAKGGGVGGSLQVELICMRLSVKVVQRCHRDSYALLCDREEPLAVTSYN